MYWLPKRRSKSLEDCMKPIKPRVQKVTQRLSLSTTTGQKKNADVIQYSQCCTGCTVCHLLQKICTHSDFFCPVVMALRLNTSLTTRRFSRALFDSRPVHKCRRDDEDIYAVSLNYSISCNLQIVVIKNLCQLISTLRQFSSLMFQV